ncbi:MAG: universal stress protein [Cyclobacteriaceae bacterium]
MIENPIVRKHQAIKEKASTRKNNLRLFVPIDFSLSSYNALRYAMHVARMCEGTIDLFHNLKSDNYSITESPLTVQHEIRKAESKAYKKLSSVKEIINNFGVNVTSTYVAIGDPVCTLKNRMHETSSHVLVLDKNEKIAKGNDMETPCLYVPSMIMPMTPNKVLMIRDGRPIHEKSLMPLLEILDHSKNQLTVVDCVQSIKKMLFRYGITLGNSKIDFTRKFELVHSTVKELAEVITKYSPDLICQMQKKNTWWEKLLGINSSQKIYFEVPTLVIPDSKP